jgi:hypothetical protein
MRKILFFVLLLCFGNIANAQLTGVKAIMITQAFQQL